MSYRDRLEELWESTEASQAHAKSRKATVSFYLALTSCVLTITTLVALLETENLLQAEILALCSFLLTVITSVPAVIFGFRGLGEIRRIGGGLPAKRMAVSGTVLGLLGCLASASLFMYGVATVQRVSQRAGMG